MQTQVEQSATSRLSVLVTPNAKRKLEAEARARKITVGDLVRRKIDGERDEDEQAFIQALAQLGERAMLAVRRTDETRSMIEALAAERDARDQEIRQTVASAVTAAELDALAGTLFGHEPSEGAQ